jgi:hypothetical protein
LVASAAQLDRAAIRARAVAQFDMSVVAEQYSQLYTQVAMARK